MAGYDLRGRSRVFDFNVDFLFRLSECDAMVFGFARGKRAKLASGDQFTIVTRSAPNGAKIASPVNDPRCRSAVALAPVAQHSI
jgi:hypothetical protein